MKTNFLKSLLTIACLLCSIGVYAHDFEVDGIYYHITNKTDNTVEVTYRGAYYDTYPDEYIGSVVIPETVTYGNTYSVTSIGYEAFSGCKGLTSVTVPSSVTSIDSYAFSACIGLTEVTIPKSVTSIGQSAFSNCKSLTSITIPDNVTSISRYAFFGCKSLTEITIPNRVTSIGWGAFSGCTGLTEITIPNSVTSIDAEAFSGCSGLTSVTIGNSVTSIGNSAFSDCTGLIEITIPNSVTYIDEKAFRNCTGLTTVNFNAENCKMVGADSYATFNGCKNITTINIGDKVKKIPYYAFGNCTGLTEITIPNSVTEIGAMAFSGCSGLTSVTIGNSVTSIWTKVFWGCSGLTEIRVEAVTPPTIKYAFYDGNTSIPLYVPASSVEAYQNADYWKDFTNIQAITVPDVIATSLTLDNEVLDMYIGDAVQLTATVLPDNTTNKVVTWTSSDNEVATVDENGNVIAVSIGTATITATTTDGSELSATCEVTVEQKMVKLTMQNSYYNNVIFFLLPGTEQKIQIINTDPIFVLNTVMFNEEDVTEQLVDGVFTTPALEEDAVINISYDIPTAEETPMQNSRIKAYGYRGDVVVVGCERGDSIAIYDVDGILLRTIFATSDTMRIAMPIDAIYVVKVADTAVKVAL